VVAAVVVVAGSVVVVTAVVVVVSGHGPAGSPCFRWPLYAPSVLTHRVCPLWHTANVFAAFWTRRPDSCSPPHDAITRAPMSATPIAPRRADMWFPPFADPWPAGRRYCAAGRATPLTASVESAPAGS
jgi:hypothetical protein